MPNNTSEVFTVGTNQTIAVGAASVAVTNPFGGYTTVVRLCSTTACHIKVAVTPVATTSDPYLPAHVEWFIEVAPGQKVAAIQNTAGGTLHVTEMG
jgi:hypothetical protein